METYGVQSSNFAARLSWRIRGHRSRGRIECSARCIG